MEKQVASCLSTVVIVTVLLIFGLGVLTGIVIANAGDSFLL